MELSQTCQLRIAVVLCVREFWHCLYTDTGISGIDGICLSVFGERDSMKNEMLIEGLKVLPESEYVGMNYGRGISPKYLAKIVVISERT